MADTLLPYLVFSTYSAPVILRTSDGISPGGEVSAKRTKGCRLRLRNAPTETGICFAFERHRDKCSGTSTSAVPYIIRFICFALKQIKTHASGTSTSAVPYIIRFICFALKQIKTHASGTSTSAVPYIIRFICFALKQIKTHASGTPTSAVPYIMPSPA